MEVLEAVKLLKVLEDGTYISNSETVIVFCTIILMLGILDFASPYVQNSDVKDVQGHMTIVFCFTVCSEVKMCKMFTVS